MWYTRPKEFESLRKEYQNAITREERRIKLKLDEIAACYGECTAKEREFADDITRKFCELIKILDIKHEAEKKESFKHNKQFLESAKEYSGFIPFDSSDALLKSFYNRFKDEKSESTLKDYVARIKTFVNVYLWNVPGIIEIWHRENDQKRMDDVLFTYKYLEYILARFDTKEEGVSNKQKNNIRSALRKLNEFKQENQLRR